MKVIDLGNAIQVKDIDLYNDDECRELGKLIAHECVVFIDDAVSEKRLHDMQLLWGDASRGIVNEAVATGKLTGKHWRDLYLYIGYVADQVKELSDTMSRVSFARTEKNRPTGIFTTGELDWHSDQQSRIDAQRIIGLMSLHDSENSQTTFMRTSEAYESLNHEDKSMVDEMVSVWGWDGTLGARYLKDPAEIEVMRYSNIPIDGMETPLVCKTATGRKGIRFPNYSFSNFKGMTKDESLKFREHLWKQMNKPEYVYTRDWKDGQIMFMDQSITLHARPTDVQEGNNRTMVRNITYVNHLFDNSDPVDFVQINGERVSIDKFIEMVDLQKKEEYNNNKKKRSELWSKE
jgi:alpha-ketoglutarate-dependent taurine dioxygenase